MAPPRLLETAVISQADVCLQPGAGACQSLRRSP